MGNNKISCPKCGSTNHSIQREIASVKKQKGCFYFFFVTVLFGLLYWTYKIIAWMILFLIWLFVLLPIRLIKKQPIKRPRISYRIIAVCQNCGYSWKINR